LCIERRAARGVREAGYCLVAIFVKNWCFSMLSSIFGVIAIAMKPNANETQLQRFGLFGHRYMTMSPNNRATLQLQLQQLRYRTKLAIGT
jgi:hypothetical protein